MKNRVILSFLLLFSLSLLAGDGRAAAAKSPSGPAKKNGTRAIIELGGFMAVSTVNYWIKYTKFIEDWQFRLNWQDQKKRLFTDAGWRLDSNAFKSNWTHALSGAVYYSMARSNRLSWLESSLYSLGGSAFWEMISEWREIISINDMVFTPLGGPAIGESLFQMSSHFLDRPGIVNQVAGSLLNPVHAINRLLAGRRERVHATEETGWHRFEGSLALQQGESPRDGSDYTHYDLGLEMKRIPLAGYGLPGEYSGFIRAPLVSSLDFHLSLGAREMEEFRFRTQTILFGYWSQRLSRDAAGGLRGHALLLGFGSCFDLFKKKALVPYDASSGALSNPRYLRPRPTDFNDKLAAISLAGPALELAIFSPRARLRWTADAYFDFALVNSLPLNAYSVDHSLDDAKTTVLSWGYYYGLGYSLSSAAVLDLGRWQWRGGVRYQSYRSLQGMDRFQDAVKDDFKLRDTFLTLGGSVGMRPTRADLTLRLGWESIRRSGLIRDFALKTRENRWFTQMSLGF